MSKYKVGDKVRIRANLEVGKRYGGMTLFPWALEFKGATLTIRRITGGSKSSDHDYFCTPDKNDKEGYWYSGEMLEPASTNKFDWEAFKTEKIAVHCDTEKKAKAFLRECDKHGIKWKSGDKATNVTNWITYGKATCFECCAFEALTFSDCSFFKSRNFKIIEYPFAESAEYPEIHITTDGKKTVAVKTLNGKEIARGIARCHPDDKFDFNVGAYVALEHLNHPFKPRLENIRYPNRWYGFIGEKISATTVSGEPIHIGDTVEIYNSALERTYRVFIHGRTAEGGTEVFIGHSSEAEYKNGCNKLQDIIVKITKPYTELKNGEMIGDEIKAVLKE